MKIVLNNIAKKYEGNVDYTLENVSFEINSGEFVVLLGPSGSGKTTLLRMISGLISITKGDLFFGSKRVNNILPKERDIAMVFQSYALYPTMDVFNNIAFSLKMNKVPKSEIYRKVTDVSKVLGIEHILYKKPSEISGGQRQRVALGRAIVRKPSIFLMDEPLSNLDAKLRDVMRNEIKRIHKFLNTTSVYVTHDQHEAMSLADRILVINNNEIQQIGTPDELYFKPSNLFVAKFIGNPENNFIEGKINKGYFLSDHIKSKIKVKTDFEGEAIMSVRPEDIVMAKDKKASDIILTLLDIKKIGHTIEYLAAGAGGKQFQITISRNGFINNNSKEGEKCAFKLRNMLFFDKEKGVLLS